MGVLLKGKGLVPRSGNERAADDEAFDSGTAKAIADVAYVQGSSGQLQTNALRPGSLLSSRE
jgi:hypothetical protein